MMRKLIRAFDGWLRRVLGVFEFCDDPTCLLRVRRTVAAHAVALPNRCLPAGAPILELHLWNEHVPPLPPSGPDLAWAVQIHRRLQTSFRTLARQIGRDARLSGVQAVGGIAVLPRSGAGSGDLFARLGFALCPYRGPLARFGEFWENLYTWAIMWTYNPVTLRRRRLLRLHRCEIWMTVDDLVRRYGQRPASPVDEQQEG